MNEQERESTAGEDTCDAFCFNEELVERLREALPVEAQVRRTREFFSAFGNRTRLLVLFCLVRADELCVCDLASALEMNLSTVSHQLRHLRALGLVDYRREGKMAFYRLTEPRVEELLTNQFEREAKEK